MFMCVCESDDAMRTLILLTVEVVCDRGIAEVTEDLSVNLTHAGLNLWKDVTGFGILYLSYMADTDEIEIIHKADQPDGFTVFSVGRYFSISPN